MKLEYAFLLNNDAVVLPETLQELLKSSARHLNRAILGSLVRFMDSGAIQFQGADQNRAGDFEWRKGIEPESMDSIATDFVFGAALFASVTIFDELGLLDERFFLNCEEVDFCVRAREKGYESFIVPSSVVLHSSGASLGEFEGPLQKYFMTRNRLLFIEKNGTWRQRIRAHLTQAKWSTKHILQDLKSCTQLTDATKASLMGIRDYWLRDFGDCPAIVRRMAAANRSLHQQD